MKSYIFLIFASLFIFNIVSSSFAAVNDGDEEAKTENDALANVVILNFINKSNLRRYKYLSASFSEAMRSTFNKLFTYKRVNKTKTHKALQQILQKSKRRWHQIKLINIKALAEQEKLDVVIYGEYVRLKTGLTPKKKHKIDRIKITTKIYFSFLDEEITLSTRVSKLDHSIFSIMKEIAQSSVANIHKHIDFTATNDEENQNISPVLVISINQNIKIDDFEAELEYMRSQLDRDFTAKISLVDHYIREKIDVNIRTPKEKKKILSTLVRRRQIKQMMQISTDGNIFKMNLMARRKPVKTITYPINASEQIKHGHIRETANFFNLKAKGVKTATKNRNSVILVLPKLNTSSEDEQEKQQTDTEINHIKKIIDDYYDARMLFFTDDLKKNIFLAMPSDAKQDLLKSLIKKYKIHKLLKVKIQSGLITTKVIVNYKFKRQFTYSIGASNAIKKVNFQKMAYTLGLKKATIVRRGKSAFKISALQKMQKNSDTVEPKKGNVASNDTTTSIFIKQKRLSLGIRSGYSFLLGKLSSQIRHYYTTDFLVDIHLSNILNRNEQSIPLIQAAISFEGFQTNTDKAFYDFSLKVGPHWLFPLLGKNQYWGVGLLSVFTYETTIEKTLSQQVDLYTFGFDAFITYEYRISNYRFYLHPRLSYRYDVDLPLYGIGMLGGVSYRL